MNYELAKKLKEAGFPQRGLDGKLYKVKEEYKDSQEFIDMQPTVPTLSELIEACGNAFGRLENADWILDKEEKVKGNRHWRAYMTENHFYNVIKSECVIECCGYEYGETPEEAVANLWLELNQK